MSNRSCNCLSVVDKPRLPFRLVAFSTAIMFIQTLTFSQSVTMALDTNTISIGDQARLTITAIRSITQNQADFSWPNWKDSLPGGIELLGGFDADTTAVDLDNGDMAFAMHRTYRVTCWDSGFIAIPPVGIPFGLDTIFSNSLVLNVLLAPPGEAGKIAAAADIRETQWTWIERLWRWLPWIIGSILALGILAFIWTQWRKRERTEKIDIPEKRVPKEAAHVIALRALERIELDAIWKQGEAKKHHAITSEVLRRYLEGRFEFRALERSTEEIKQGIPNLPLLEQDREILLEILNLTDLVKFAKWSPSTDDHIRIVKRAIRFVEQTLPTSEASESNSAS